MVTQKIVQACTCIHILRWEFLDYSAGAIVKAIVLEIFSVPESRLKASVISSFFLISLFNWWHALLSKEHSIMTTTKNGVFSSYWMLCHALEKNVSRLLKNFLHIPHTEGFSLPLSQHLFYLAYDGVVGRHA